MGYCYIIVYFCYKRTEIKSYMGGLGLTHHCLHALYAFHVPVLVWFVTVFFFDSHWSPSLQFSLPDRPSFCLCTYRKPSPPIFSPWQRQLRFRQRCLRHMPVPLPYMTAARHSIHTGIIRGLLRSEKSVFVLRSLGIVTALLTFLLSN